MPLDFNSFKNLQDKTKNLILQFGHGYMDIQFPIAFTEHIFLVLINVNQPYGYSPKISNLTLTTLTANYVNTNGTTTDDGNGYWLSIGY